MTGSTAGFDCSDRKTRGPAGGVGGAYLSDANLQSALKEIRLVGS